MQIAAIQQLMRNSAMMASSMARSLVIWSPDHQSREDLRHCRPRDERLWRLRFAAQAERECVRSRPVENSLMRFVERVE
jgi:hypothetical protein